MKNYLPKNWYNVNVENYNAHNLSNNNYYGYWSFEVGAIALTEGNCTVLPLNPKEEYKVDGKKLMSGRLY